MSNTLLAHALRYAALGWCVFPLQPGAKIPATKHGCRDASSDPAQINQWWSANPLYNIGLACGVASGVYVVDVDIDPSKGIDGPASLIKFPAMPVTVVSETPRGGFHWLFRTDTPPANKNSFRPGVDIRADGYYIVLPPSTHPNGGAYEWRDGQSPWDLPLAEYPDAMRPRKQAPSVPWQRPTESATVARIPATGNSVEDRAIAYLQECEPATQGFAGHDKLLWAARAMVKGFCLPEETAAVLLGTHYNPRCTPPWDLSNPKDEKDFRRKVAEAVRTPALKPDGWLLVDDHPQADEQFTDYANALAERLLANELRVGGKSRQPLAVDLLRPPGLVGEIAEWLESSAMRSQPLLNLGAALTFCGALLGRKVKDEWDSRTNIYAMGVGHSSAGKNHPLTALRQLASKARIIEMIGGSRVTGAAALERRMEQHPVTLFLWDEIGDMMLGLKNNRGDIHAAQIKPTLMEMYSSANKTMGGGEYAQEGAKIIVQPHLCLYGVTGPEKFMSGLSPEDLRSGMVGRILVFVSKTRPPKDYERSRGGGIPDSLVERVQNLWAMQPAPPAGTGDIQAATEPQPFEVETSPEALARIIELDLLADKMMEADDHKGIDCLWGKATENAKKIALIVAVGDGSVGNWGERIEYKHADYGCRLVEKIINDLIQEIQSSLHESQFERDKAFVLETVKKAGREGISKRDLTRKTQRFDGRLRESIVKDLIESGDINISPDGKSVRLFLTPWGLV